MQVHVSRSAAVGRRLIRIWVLMEQLIRRQRLCLLLLLVVVFLSAAVGGARAVDARAGGQDIGIDQSNISVPTVKIGGGGHGGHGGHGHGNGGGEHGRGMPETPPVFDPRTVGGNSNQHRGRSAASIDLSRSSTCVLLAVATTILLLHL